MGYTLEAWTLDTDDLIRRAQAGDEALIAKVKGFEGSDLDRISKLLEEMEVGVDDPEEGKPGFFARLFGAKAPEPRELRTTPLTVDECLNHLFSGGEKHQDAWFAYGYLLTWAAGALGEELDNGPFQSMRSGANWLPELAKGLKKAGVSPNVFDPDTHLTGRPLPVDLPETDDFPYTGYLTASETAAALTALEMADFQAAAAATKTPDHALVSYRAMLGWMKTATAKGWGIFASYA
jgi:hypothetical protein